MKIPELVSFFTSLLCTFLCSYVKANAQLVNHKCKSLLFCRIGAWFINQHFSSAPYSKLCGSENYLNNIEVDLPKAC